jgi:CspA family cold shock protein
LAPSASFPASYKIFEEDMYGEKYDDQRSIKPEDGGRDVFVHIRALERGRIDLPEIADRLSFEVTAGRNGKPEATAIKRVGS